MPTYARTTEVPADRSVAEIGTILRRFGATSFGHAWEDGGKRAAVIFVYRNRQIRFELEMPDPQSPEFTRDGRGKMRKPNISQAAWEQATRAKWRALCLAIKAKLVSVQEKIFTFDEEFAIYTVAPDGQTFGQHVIPKMDAVLKGAPIRGLLPAKIERAE